MNRKIAITTAAAMLTLTGCSSLQNAITNSASGKNLNMEGYLMTGEIETTNAETGTPCGKMILGRISYKSRKVAIPADQKVPTTGYYKSTKTKSLFGTEENIVEFDYTAGSDAEAEKALTLLKEFSAKNETSEQKQTSESQTKQAQ